MNLADDFEIQGKFKVKVSMPMSGTMHTRETNLFLLLRPYVSGILFQLLPNA